jgi:hypothetical protein
MKDSAAEHEMLLGRTHETPNVLMVADGPTARQIPFYSFKFVDWALGPQLNHSA